jgi:hypothetical protein
VLARSRKARGDVKTDPKYGKLREPALYIIGVLRALNVKSFDKTSTSDGVFGQQVDGRFYGSLDQPIFQPATVFSYYQPGYEVPGIKVNGTRIRNPVDCNDLAARKQRQHADLYRYYRPTVLPPRVLTARAALRFDLANLEALANTPSALLDQLNALMLHGTMSTQVRTSNNSAINSVPTSDGKLCSEARSNGPPTWLQPRRSTTFRDKHHGSITQRLSSNQRLRIRRHGPRLNRLTAWD